jgi:hypothetical protein
MTINNTQTTITDNPEISRTITRYQNVDENEIVITESKLENILMKHSNALTAGSDWKTPLGLIIAIIIVFLTTEFNKNFLGLQPTVWQAIFIICLFLSCGWLLSSIISKIKHRNENLGKVIGLIKNSERKNEQKPENNKEKGLKIIKASYGIEENGKNVNVTNKLNDLIIDNKLVINATNALVVSDPAPGIVKKLIVKYKYNGVTFSKEFKERDSVNLP